MKFEHKKVGICEIQTVEVFLPEAEENDHIKQDEKEK